MRGPDWHLVADDMITHRFELLRFVLDTCEYDFWTDELFFGYFDCVWCSDLILILILILSVVPTVVRYLNFDLLSDENL